MGKQPSFQRPSWWGLREIHSIVDNQWTKSKWWKTSVYRQVKLIKSDRPGTSVSGDPNDLEALSLNQLLQLKGKPIMLKSSTIKEEEIK